jgi:hypothetical protein
MASADARHLLHRLLAGDDAAVGAIVTAARGGDDPVVLSAAALFVPDGDALLARAAAIATTTRDRQLVAIATAHRHGERQLVDALAREHLVDHPDSVLVAWIAEASRRQTSTMKEGA